MKIDFLKRNSTRLAIYCANKLSKSSMLLVFSLICACSVLEPALPPDEELLDGPIEGLTLAESAQFLAGDIAFNDEVFNSKTGLGPLFVSTSCGSCHAGDGKGHPFTTLTRFGQKDHTGNQYLHLGGPQLQHRAIAGYQPELIPVGATSTKLTPPANTGLGFLELVSDADLLAMADPDDINNDGVSGVPNWNKVPSFVEIPSGAIERDGKYIGRFGKKAATFDLLQQTVSAYNQDMGISSTFIPHDTYSGKTVDPEVSDHTIRQVVAYLQMLKVPISRAQDDPDVKAGKALFMNAGCESCHKQSLRSGQSRTKALSNKTFYPYTDLLLHDMGPGLDDGYTEGSATSSEWRTPPLWGLGLSPASQGGQYYLMHDGRAHTIDEAIKMHGGEAGNSLNNYNKMADTDKTKLLRFLNSL